MVQRANFAFDDEELSDYLGRNADYWSDDEQEEQPDPELPDPGFGDGFSEVDLDMEREQSILNVNWETDPPRKENQGKSPEWAADLQENQE